MEEIEIDGKNCRIPDRILTAGRRNRIADKIRLWGADIKDGAVKLEFDSGRQKEIIKGVIEPDGIITDSILDNMPPERFDELFEKCVTPFLNSFAKAEDKKK